MSKLEPIRAYLYPVLVAGVALLVAYGIVDDGQAAVWVALGAALLGAGTVGIEAARSKVSPVDRKAPKHTE